MFEHLRKNCFWLIDTLKGGNISKYYKDIDNFEKNGIDFTEVRLENILKYAKNNVPFYNNISVDNLSNFPVMNKSLYKEGGDIFISTDYVSKIDKLYKASTSGSTGTPFIVYQNSSKRNRLRADLIHAHEGVKWNLGDHYIFIRNWVSNYNQSTIKNLAQNVTNISVSDFDDDKKMWLCNHLKKKTNSIIFGYASSVCDFYNFLRNRRINPKNLKIKLVVCDSDELTLRNKRALEEYFNCPVINRYDNEENGLLAITKPYDDKFITNYTSLYFELLEINSDTSVAPGEVGRVVITDYFNKAMPLIRYDTGDLAVSNDMPGDIRTLSALKGRSSDYLYSVDGKKISGVAISGITEIFDSIERYQLVQNSKCDFIFTFSGELSNRHKNALDKRLKDALGMSASIRYLKKSYIPQTQNGKYKTIVRNYDE